MPDLSDATNWSETDAANNKASPNGWPEGMMPSGVNDTGRADRGALKRFWDKINPIQVVTPSGGVWLFTTGNVTYPSSYVNGEVYCFTAGGSSVGGDYLEVNALGGKPIWKRITTGSGWAPIIAQDISTALMPQLVYASALNAGVGAFILLNPFVPIYGNGAGGVSVSGALAVTGALTTGSITANGLISSNGSGAGLVFQDRANSSINWLWYSTGNIARLYDGGDKMLVDSGGNLTAVGQVSANGYQCRAGIGGATTGNQYNIQWPGSGAANLWIDNVNEGPIVTAPGGTISAGALSIGGTATIGGELVVTNNGAGSGGISIYATAAGIRSDAGGTALYLPNGDISCQNIVAVGASAGGAGSNLAILCSNGGIQSSFNGTAFYAPNGNVICQNITAATQGFKPGGGSWVATSDARLKKNVHDYDRGLDAVLALRPISYEYNGKAGTPKDGRRFVGLVADEVLPVMPEMVGTTRELLDDAPTEIKTLDQTALTFALVNAVQEIANRLAALEAK
jgi:hypothetical protein